jgi:TRAP-type mannitol/chloroaromatic compound transport system substrate-binding protein
MDAAAKASFEIYDDLASKSAHWKRIYPAWKKFRTEETLWFRVAENTDDNFLFHTTLGQS